MRVNYIEDNLLHQKVFVKKFKEHSALENIKLSIISGDEIDYIYKEMSEKKFGSTDIFIIDIYLGKEYTGIDFAKKIRSIYPQATIIFFSNDNSRGRDIINARIFPDYYIDKMEFESVFTLIEKAMKERKEKTIDYLSVVKFPGLINDVFVTPFELNYISTINGERSSLIVHSENESFFIQDKMKNIKNKLARYGFFNKLKSFSINPYNINKIDKKNLKIVFKNGDSIMLSYSSIRKIEDYMSNLFNDK